MSAQLDALTQEVSATSTVIDSAINLIQGLSQQIKDAGTDPAALEALTVALDGETQKLANAVAAGTPAAASTPDDTTPPSTTPTGAPPTA